MVYLRRVVLAVAIVINNDALVRLANCVNHLVDRFVWRADTGAV